MKTLNNKILRKPEWLKVQLTSTSDYSFLKKKLSKDSLHTICESGNCPNQAECWAQLTATFLILGNVCTRNCKFCNVTKGKPIKPDKEEPKKIANLIQQLKLKHTVITSVTRDDLPDGGASHWAMVIKEIKYNCPTVTIEALIPDFQLSETSLNIIVEAAPNIVSHNLETVERLTPLIRSYANYKRSLKVLKFLSQKKIKTKSGIMVGLGETDEEVYKTMDDILEVGCKILTIGQYLQPSLKHFPVDRYVHPSIFDEYREVALKKGFIFVESTPLARSSYHSSKHIL
ncbi:MAG TPA: lipoyl synthase [Bacteroidales bacterium]|nr:lipoyl synthase [Bacteroidales bacterium]